VVPSGEYIKIYLATYVLTLLPHLLHQNKQADIKSRLPLETVKSTIGSFSATAGVLVFLVQVFLLLVERNAVNAVLFRAFVQERVCICISLYGSY